MPRPLLRHFYFTSMSSHDKTLKGYRFSWESVVK